MKQGAVIFFDVLGIKGLWKKYPSSQIINNIKKLREVVKSHTKLGTSYLTSIHAAGGSLIKLELSFISDSFFIFCWYEKGKKGNNNCSLAYILGKIAAEVVREATLLNPPMSLRGALSTGRFEFSDNILIGPAVDDAATYYEQTDGAFIVITPKAKKCLKEAEKSGVLSPEEVSLFVNHKVAFREVKPKKSINKTLPVLNCLAEEPLATQKLIVDNMLSSFDPSIPSVAKKRGNTQDFLQKCQDLPKTRKGKTFSK